MKNDNSMLTKLFVDDKEIILIGTAHVSKESSELVESVINKEKPDTVSVELCESRFQAIAEKNKWRNMDIIKVIKEKKASLLLLNLLLAAFQKKIADAMNIKPGQEMITAIKVANEIKADIHLADREIQITLSRIWRIMGLWEKCKMFFQFLFSMSSTEEITKEDIEKMKQEDVLQTLLSDVGKSHPVLRKILINERDLYLASKIRNAPGKKIVAVVGAGHVPGIKEHWNTDIDIKSLEELPAPGKFSGILKWMIPIAIFLVFALGFFYGGTQNGADMIWWWIVANGVFAGLGAVIALAHPYTIIVSIIAAPLTSLNPMIAAGWVAGLVEAFSRKPKVKDLETLPEDILSLRGFWKNSVTRVLLVVVFTNLGSSIGTMVAIPLMLKVMG